MGDRTLYDFNEGDLVEWVDGLDTDPLATVVGKDHERNRVVVEYLNPSGGGHDRSYTPPHKLRVVSHA